MKKRFIKISAGIFIGLCVVFVASTHTTHAEGLISSLFGFDGLWAVVNYIMASIANALLSLASWILAFAGMLLNFSIRLTLNIKQFVDSAPAIYNTWKAIRDISGLFFIFFLLYASILLIIGKGAGKFGQYLKDIVLAGVLINFSFFFAELGIDASNIVSMQLYNAIAPANTIGLTASTTIQSAIKNNWNDGGLSDIFMNKLQITTLYQTTSSNGQILARSNATSWTDTIKILITAIVGIIIEITAAFSFGAAALAFIARFVILIFLLAFSPVMFLSFLPEVKNYVADWTKYYKSMLIFMPVYLLLMYLGMNVLATTPLFSPSGAAGNDPTGWASLLSLGINATIVVFMLNMPLVAAASIAGKSISLLDSASKKFSSGAIWGKARDYGQAGALGAWKNTGGRAASKLAQNEGLKNFASKWKAGEVLLKGTRATAAGYDKKLADQVKSRTEFADSLGVDQRALNQAQTTLRGAQQTLASARAAGAAPAAIAAAEAAVGAAKRGVSNVENQRKQSYAGRTDSGSLDTLFLYTARKNKVAAAKVQLPILEKQLAQQKESLKETRDDIKQLTNAIRNSATGPTAAQTTELNRLQNEEATKINRINTTEDQIDLLKLVK